LRKKRHEPCGALEKKSTNTLEVALEKRKSTNTFEVALEKSKRTNLVALEGELERKKLKLKQGHVRLTTYRKPPAF
jgi:hypothetical protein